MDDLSIDAPVNISGMSFLVDSNGNKKFNPQELEKQLTSAKSNPRHSRRNVAEEIESEIDKMTLGSKNTIEDFTFNDPDSTNPFDKPEVNICNDIDDLLRTIDEDEEEYQTDSQIPQHYDDVRPPRNNNGTPIPIKDPYMKYMTNEERRQEVIGEVFNSMEEDDDGAPIFNIEKEKEEDDKSSILDSISFLMDTLRDEGEDLSRIPNVNHSNSIDEIKRVHKALLLKNDRKRCCTFAEEFILMGAHGIEYIFDGERSYRGFKPDMTDWSKSVQAKLRRMRHDTSNIVGTIMKKYNLGSGTRIALELLPSMFLYSKMRKSQHRDNLVSDEEFNAGINHMRDMEHRNDT